MFKQGVIFGIGENPFCSVRLVPQKITHLKNSFSSFLIYVV